MCIDADKHNMTAPFCVGNAGGISTRYWFIAMVKNNTEKSVAEKFKKMGLECYVPIQKEYRKRKDGRKVIVDRVIIPTVVFVYCSEAERISILPFVNRFMTDRSLVKNKGDKCLAVVPDVQIRTLQFMVGNSDTPVTFSATSYNVGDRVRVIRGNLAGLEGLVYVRDTNHSEIVIGLDFLGNARLTIETVNIEPIR